MLVFGFKKKISTHLVLNSMHYLKPFSFKAFLKILEYFLLFFLDYEILATNVRMASHAFFMSNEGKLIFETPLCYDFGFYFELSPNR